MKAYNRIQQKGGKENACNPSGPGRGGHCLP
jgi:hypothetical protein